MEDALDLWDAAVEVANGEKPCNLDYTDDIVCPFQPMGHAQLAPGRLARTVASFGMHSATSKCRVLLQNWTTEALNVLVDGKEVTIVNHFKCLGKRLTKDVAQQWRSSHIQNSGGERWSEALAASV